MRKLIKKHEEKIRFLIVGAWNFIFGNSAFFIFYYLFSAWLHYMIIFIISSIIGISQSYISFKLLVFKTKGNYLKEYFRFYSIYGLTVGLNLIFLPVLVEILHFHPVIAQILLSLLLAVISYVGHKNFSFKQGSSTA